jgi:ATP-dependent DNA helicase RecG
MPKLKEIVNQPEGRRLEFKASFPGNTELAKTIIASNN